MFFEDFEKDEELLEEEDNSGVVAMLVSIREFAKENREHKTERYIDTIINNINN